jgi:O-antigen ligase
MEISKEHPIFGVGMGTYPKIHAIYAVRREEWAIVRGTWATHSTYINILAENGAPGLILYVGFIISVFRMLMLTRKEIEPVAPVWASDLNFLSAGLAGFLVAIGFGVYHALPYLYLYVAMSIVMCDIFRRSIRSLPQAR